MPLSIRLATWSIAAALILGNPPTLAVAGPEQESQVSCRVELAPMRDGVTLATEVYLPPTPGRFPVVLTRTPYGRGSLATGSNCDNPQLIGFAQAGYVGLNQDTRGRYRSAGFFNPFQQEADDGYDAVEWAAEQPWSNGQVGIYGSSYGGVTVWQTLVAAPPHLVTAVASITASDYHDNWTYVAGAYDLQLNLGWTLAFFVGDSYRRSLEGSGLALPEIDRRVADFLATGRRDLLQQWVWTLPLNSFSAFRSYAPYYYDWLDHPDYDSYWRQVDVEHRFDEVTVPVLNTGGWYDAFAVGTMRSFQGLRANGGTTAAREGTQLVMTCCGHTGSQGLISWGPEAHAFDTKMSSGRDVSGFNRWFDHHLKGVANGVDTDPTVRLFVMVPPDTGTQGTGFELTADEYPLPNTTATRFHLRSGGHANTRHGDGTLSRDAPAGPPDRFAYDPEHPVPTMGGNLCCGDFLRRGALNQSEVELREDVLVYTSAPLSEPLTVIGPVAVTLSATSSAPDTDFTAKLVDVHLDGIAHNVLDRIVRARYRRGSKLPPSLITPGEVYEYTIDLGHTATVFRVGHRVRLEISSSNFPHFDRNPNTGHPFGQDAELATATQTIFHDATRASYVELPVLSDVRTPDDQ